MYICGQFFVAWWAVQTFLWGYVCFPFSISPLLFLPVSAITEPSGSAATRETEGSDFYVYICMLYLIMITHNVFYIPREEDSL